MNDVYFKASLQNTLNPEVGTFDNVNNKEGVFTLEDGEYYLTNNTSTSYRVYYPTKDINSVGFTIEFDINYSDSGDFGWCLLFNGSDATYWHGFGVEGTTLQFTGQGLPAYNIVRSPSTWLHVKCIFNYYLNQNYVHIYIDNVEVNKLTISKNYDIKYIDILGNSGSVSDAKIKNIIIYDSSKKHYLDTTGLTSLWSKIKSLFATKSELASKANDSDVAHKSGDETIAGTKTFTSAIVGNITGNASTATKLAAKHTIALSGAATGTATGFDGSGNITIPVTALSGSAITSAITIYDLVPDGAANHRNFYRGKDLTADFDAGTVSEHIADGTFRDIFPGDYITKSITVPQILKADGTTEYIAQTTYTVNFIIADLDIWLHRGYPSCETHHVAIVPETPPFSSYMNKSNTTKNGYLGSFMNTHVMPAFATGLQGAFGNDHILQFTFLDTKAVDNNLKSGGIVNYTGATYWFGHDWAFHYCHLMTETMVYGAPIAASCAADEIMGGVRFAAFRLNNSLVFNRNWFWLSDVASSEFFAFAANNGGTGADNASYAGGVSPFALLR